MTIAEDEELSSIEKLVRREERTNSDGTVRVEIFGWEENEGRVTVEFLTPTNDKKEEVMEFPKAGGDLEQYKFYRLLQECDLSMRNAVLLEGETVNARVEGNNWVLDCDESPSLVEKTGSVLNRAIPRKPVETAIAAVWTSIFVLLLIAAILVVL